MSWSEAELRKRVGGRIVWCTVTRLAEWIGGGDNDAEQQQQGDHRDEGRNVLPPKNQPSTATAAMW